MDINKTVELLRKRNATLQEENDRLKAQLQQQSDSDERYQKLREQLEELKDKWKEEISEMQKQRAQYAVLINDVKKARDILMGKIE